METNTEIEIKRLSGAARNAAVCILQRALFYRGLLRREKGTMSPEMVDYVEGLIRGSRRAFADLRWFARNS